jgi:hypothetical protein
MLDCLHKGVLTSIKYSSGQENWFEQKRHPTSREPSTYNTPTLDLLDAQETHGKLVSGSLSNPLESDKIGRTSPRIDKNGEGWCGKSRTLAVFEDSGVSR